MWTPCSAHSVRSLITTGDRPPARCALAKPPGGWTAHHRSCKNCTWRLRQRRSGSRRPRTAVLGAVTVQAEQGPFRRAGDSPVKSLTACRRAGPAPPRRLGAPWGRQVRHRWCLPSPTHCGPCPYHRMPAAETKPMRDIPAESTYVYSSPSLLLTVCHARTFVRIQNSTNVLKSQAFFPTFSPFPRSDFSLTTHPRYAMLAGRQQRRPDPRCVGGNRRAVVHMAAHI